MDERTEHADLDRFEFSEERLPPRVVRGRKVDYERLGLHSAGRLSYIAQQTRRIRAREL